VGHTEAGLYMTALMTSRRCFVLALSASALGLHPAFADAPVISEKARALSKFFDSLKVETLWIAGAHINWFTGEPDGVAETMAGQHTHCSAFAASVAKRLGIYILRPPEHKQALLANAQFEWLSGNEGVAQGWMAVAGAIAAQVAANAGQLVVVVYRNHHEDKPGHVAIVRPSLKSVAQIAAEGPDITQAGSKNYSVTSVKLGFAGHPAAWGKGEARYFAHEIPGAIPVD